MDLLLSFNDQQAANGFCSAMGFQDPTQGHAGGLSMYEIGTTYDADGNPLDGWWIMFRVPDGYPVPLDKIGEGRMVRRSDEMPDTGWPDDPTIPNHSFL